MHPLRSLVLALSVSVALSCAAIATSQTSQAAILTVTTTVDSGAGSLRDTLDSANSGDTIQFDPTLIGQAITLTSGGLIVHGGVTIDGPGASLLTVQRANGMPAFLIFEIQGGYEGLVTISGLTIANGVGGIDILYPDNVTIANCSIIGSIGAPAVFCHSRAAPQRGVTIANCTISGNTGGVLNGGGYGGGVYNSGGDCLGCANSSGCSMTINNTTILGNSATQGGGIYNGGGLTVSNSTISGNTASLDQPGGGGGIASSGTLTVANSTISGNSAYQGGGVLHVPGIPFLNGNGLSLTNSTITANSATVGGGVYTENGAYVGHIGNSIIALNLAPGSPDIAGTVMSDGFNLVGNNMDADISPPQVSDQIGTPGAPIDPLLGPLQDNGGPTFTHALLSGSPAIDKGHSSGSTIDQRGFTRPIDLPDIPNAPGGDGSDIGALETVGATLANISTRVRIGSGDSSMIGGFIITGTEAMSILVRGIGPSLSVPGALADPVIEIHGSAGELLASNDNWRDADSHQQIIDSGLAPPNDLESAFFGILNPGAYTVVVQGNNDATGIGLFEVYDLDQTVNSRLANISTRGLVGTSDDVMVGGTIVIGSHPVRLLLRAIGPSLTAFGVPNALLDPMLELHDGNGALLFSNDNWRSDQEAEIIATGIPPESDQESAILRELAPGNYTAIVRGANNTTGIAIVEAYELN